MWRRLLVVCVAAAGGCWSDDTLIDGAFTPQQFAQLAHDLHLPAQPPDGCKQAKLDEPACDAAKALADLLFRDASLSGGQCKTTTPAKPCWSDADCPGDTCGTWTPVSCVSCHNPNVAFIDTRTPSNVSIGSVGATKRNAMTLLGIAYKPQFITTTPDVYTWSGGAKLPGHMTATRFDTAGAVFDLALLKPMSSSHVHVALLINAKYAPQYTAAFGSLAVSPDTMVANVEQAFTAYFASQPFVRGATPFDHYLDGQADAISASAKRGFAIFVGKGTCIECHKQAMFSDYDFHDTGVMQTTGSPQIDNGRGDITTHEDDGKFLTPSLRDVALTSPYFHDGSRQTLADVIAFYRQGGDPTGFSGMRDPRIQPLDLTDQDAADLEAFLNALTQCTATTCPPPSPGGTRDAGMPPPPDSAVMPDANGPLCAIPTWTACPDPMSPMGYVCADLQTDPLHCGSCTNGCSPQETCIMATCVCPTGTNWCVNACVDFQTDPANCGMCGHACTGSHVCVAGMCQ
jgi:cytochrome c peroxidase